MDLFEFLGKLDESSASYHFEVENEGSSLTLKLDIDGGGGFFSRYNVTIRMQPRGLWEAHGLPDGDAAALIEAYELAERHGTRCRSGDEYSFDLESLVDLIADVR